MRWDRALVVAAALGVPGLAGAEALGKLGPTYGIEEPHLLDWIQHRLREKEQSGEIARLMADARARAVEAIRHPKPVAGLERTEVARTFYYDPSFTLAEDVVDERGNVLFPRGTRKNPLEVVALSKHLLFFDGRDGAQVKRAREVIGSYGGRVKPILVGGSYLELMRDWGTRVFYDQEGIARRLGITQVPAIVSQEGDRLRIDEVKP